jgi:hypothetical protein
MPFSDVEGLDTDTLQKMTQVFDMACERLAVLHALSDIACLCRTRQRLACFAHGGLLAAPFDETRFRSAGERLFSGHC